MTTQTICDYPKCGKPAVWKVELSDILGDLWSFTGTLNAGPPRRTSMDVCAKHLPRVSFDLNEIAEFEREKSA